MHKKSSPTHKCDECSMSFRTPGNLKRHILTHTGEKPFNCPHCDYSCNNIVSVNIYNPSH